MLQHNSTLSELGLSGKLPQLLLCLHTLRCMLVYILSSSCFAASLSNSAEGGCAVLEALERNSTLTHLVLSCELM